MLIILGLVASGDLSFSVHSSNIHPHTSLDSKKSSRLYLRLFYFFIDRYKKSYQGFIQILPLILLMLFAASTFFIVWRVQQQRTGELRQFAKECDNPYGCAASPKPTTKPTEKPAPTKTPSQSAADAKCGNISNTALQDKCYIDFFRATPAPKTTVTPKSTTTTAPAKTPVPTRDISYCYGLSFDARARCLAAYAGLGVTATTVPISPKATATPVSTTFSKSCQQCVSVRGSASACASECGLASAITPKATVTQPVSLPTQLALNQSQCGGKGTYDAAKKICVIPTILTAGPSNLPSFCWFGVIGTDCPKQFPSPSPVAAKTTTAPVTTVVTPKPTVTPAPNAGCLGNCNKCQYGSTGLLWAAKCNPAPTAAPSAAPSGPSRPVIPTKPPTPATTKAPQPSVTPIAPEVATKPASTITPSVTPKITPVPGAGRACPGSNVTVGNTAVGGQKYTGSDGGTDVTRQCKYDPVKNETYWATCYHCPITVGTAEVMAANKDRNTTFTSTVNTTFQAVAQCMAEGGDQATCQAKAFASLTGPSQEYTQLLQSQVSSQVATYQGQNDYNKNLELFDWCAAQHGTTAGACDGYLQDANNALVAVGINPNDPKTAALLHENYHTYIVNKASSLYINAALSETACKAQTPPVDCSVYTKNKEAALSYVGVLPTDESGIIQRYNLYQKATDIWNKPNSEVCGGRIGCDPEEAKQKLIAALHMDPQDATAIHQSWVDTIVYNVKSGIVGIEVPLCKQLAAKASDCNTLEGARNVILDFVPADQVAAMRARFTQFDLFSLVNGGSDADVTAYVNSHKNDPALKGIDLSNLTAVRTALDKTLGNLSRINLPAEVQKALAESGTLASRPSLKGTRYEQEYEKWRAEQIAQADAHDRTTIDVSPEAFDKMQADAFASIQSSCQTKGNCEILRAQWLAGTFIPSEEAAKQKAGIESTASKITGIVPVLDNLFGGKVTWIHSLSNFDKQIATGLVTKVSDIVTNSQLSWYNTIGMPQDTALTKAKGYIGLLPQATKQQYLDGLDTNADAQTWMKANNKTKEDYLVFEMQQFYANKPTLEQTGHFRSGDISEDLYVRDVLVGKENVAATVDKMGFFGKAAFIPIQVVDSISGGWVTQRLTPNLIALQERGVATKVVTDLTDQNPTLLSTIETQIKTDPSVKQEYEEWKKTADPAHQTTFDFAVHRVTTGYAIVDNISAGIYQADGAKQLMAVDPSWLTNAALTGKLNLNDLKTQLAQSSQNATDAYWNYINNSKRDDAALKAYNQQLTEIKNTQGDIIAQAYLSSLDEKTQQNLVKSITEKTGIIDPKAIADWEKSQLATFIADSDVQYMMSIGAGKQLEVTKVLDGTYNMVGAAQAVADLRSTQLGELAFQWTKFTDGGLLKGQLILNDPTSNGWDKTRAVVMMTAKPIATGVSIIIPGGAIVRMGLEAMTIPMALNVAGSALSIQMTGSAATDVAQKCTFHSDMDVGGCVTSTGMLVFAGGSALSSVKGLNQMVKIANLTSGADEAALSVAKATKDGLQSAAAGEAFQGSNDAVNVAAKAFSQPLPNPLAQRALNVVGTVTFGAQALDTCSKTGIFNADCVLTAGLAVVSGVRSSLPTSLTNPETVAGRVVMTADQAVNTGLAVTGCAAALAGQATWEHCGTAAMMAGLSYGHLAAESLTKNQAQLEDPWVVQEKSFKAMADIQNAPEGTEITYFKITKDINGHSIVTEATAQITAANRAELLTQSQQAYSAGILSAGQLIGQTNQAIKEIAKDLPGKNLTLSEQKLADMVSQWKEITNPDGTIKDAIRDSSGNITKAITSDEVQALRSAIVGQQALVEAEQVVREPPKLSFTDQMAGLFGRGPAKEFSAAEKAFAEAAKKYEPGSPQYEAAKDAVTASRKTAETASYTQTQKDLAARIDSEQKSLDPLTKQELALQEKIIFLSRPEEIAAELKIRNDTLVAHQQELADSIANNADPAVTTKARDLVTQARQSLDRMQAISDQDVSIGNNIALRQTEIANTTVALDGVTGQEAAIRTRITGFQASLAQAGTFGGRLAAFWSGVTGRPVGGQPALSFEEQAQKLGIMPKFSEEGKKLITSDISKVKAGEVVENGKRVATVTDTSAVRDRGLREYLTQANDRLTKVQKALGFAFYSRGLEATAPQDQLGNIVRGATRGDESPFLNAPGGSGKTELSATTASERFHFSGRKQLMVVESPETILENRGTETRPGPYEKIFETEGIKRYYLTDRVSNLSPEEFAKLQAADVVVTTNKIAYEWLPDYGKGGAHPENQLAFVKGLESGPGFEFVVDEVKTIWGPSQRFSISGDSVTYATTLQGRQDVAELAKALGWHVDEQTGQVTRLETAPGTFAKLQAEASRLLDAKGSQGLRELFDEHLANNQGENLLRQDLRVSAYRDILLELKATHPEASRNIDTLLGEFTDTSAFQKALADPAKSQEAFDSFEKRINGMSEAKLTGDTAMNAVRDGFLKQADVLETIAHLYADVIGNTYEPVRRLTVDANGVPQETLVVVPKDRNIFEGKQISRGMQNLVYNTVGKELYAKITGKELPISVNDVTVSQNPQEITILEVNSRAKSTLGLSLEANEVADVWSGAVGGTTKLGDQQAINDFLYGSIGKEGEIIPAKRPIAGIFEVENIDGINTHIKTRAQATGEKGAMIVNAANTEASNIEVRENGLSQFGDSTRIIRNRNNLHVIEVVDHVVEEFPEQGRKVVEITRVRVEPVEKNGESQFQAVREQFNRTVDAFGRMIAESAPQEVFRGKSQADAPLTLKDLDAVKLVSRGQTLSPEMQARFDKVTALGISPKESFYVDYYEKGADIGVNPLSYADESLRVVGDRFNSSSEWYQALIRARGNEGGTADVYTKFSPDAEFIVIGDKVRNLTLDEFREMADRNGIVAVQKQATATRLQFINEFMSTAVKQLASYLPEGEAQTRVTSLLESGQRRMNVRIGAVQVDIEAELARQARVAQETIDQIAQMPEIKRQLGGIFGIGGNRQLRDLVRTLTTEGGRPIASSLPDSLDFSKPIDPKTKVAPYTQANNIAQVIKGMEAYTFVDAKDPLASTILNSVVRGLNEVQTSFVATNTSQDIARSQSIGADAIKNSASLITKALQDTALSGKDTYALTLGYEEAVRLGKEITDLEAKRTNLPIVTQSIAQPGTLRPQDVVVGKDLEGLEGAQRVKIGSLLSWTDTTGKVHEELLDKSTSVFTVPSGVTKVRISTDGFVSEIELGPDAKAALVTDSSKGAQEFGELYDVNRQIAQKTQDYKNLLGPNVLTAYEKSVSRNIDTRLRHLLTSLGVANIGSATGLSQYAAAAEATLAYEHALAVAINSLNNRALTTHPEEAVAKATEKEHAGMLRAMNALLTVLASQMKDAATSKAFTNLDIIKKAAVNSYVSLSDGGTVRITDEARRAELIAVAQKQTVPVVDRAIDALSGALIKEGISSQNRQIKDRIAAEKRTQWIAGVFERFSEFGPAVRRIPRAFTAAFVRVKQAPASKPVIGTGTVDTIIAGLSQSRYADLYAAIDAATANNKTEDIARLTSAARSDIASRLTGELGVTPDPASDVVTAVLMYESTFIQHARDWTLRANRPNTVASFTEDIDANDAVSVDKQTAIVAIQTFAVLQNRTINPQSIFGIVAQPVVASAYAAITSELQATAQNVIPGPKQYIFLGLDFTGLIEDLQMLGSGMYHWSYGANPAPGIRALVTMVQTLVAGNVIMPDGEDLGQLIVWAGTRFGGFADGPAGWLTSGSFLAWDGVRGLTAPVRAFISKWQSNQPAPQPQATGPTVSIPAHPADTGVPATGLRRLLYTSNPFAYGLTAKERLGKVVPYVLVRTVLPTIVTAFFPPVAVVTGPAMLYTLYHDFLYALPPQTRINIANGSREGFVEDVVNMHPFFGIGKSPWRLRNLFDVFPYVASRSFPVVGQSLLMHDVFVRIPRAFGLLKSTTTTQPTIVDPQVIWRRDATATLFGKPFNYGSWLNATPKNQTIKYIISRPILSVLTLGAINIYDGYRLGEAGFFKTLFDKTSWMPWTWRWWYPEPVAPSTKNQPVNSADADVLHISISGEVIDGGQVAVTMTQNGQPVTSQGVLSLVYEFPGDPASREWQITMEDGRIIDFTQADIERLQATPEPAPSANIPSSPPVAPKAANPTSFFAGVANAFGPNPWGEGQAGVGRFTASRALVHSVPIPVADTVVDISKAMALYGWDVYRGIRWVVDAGWKTPFAPATYVPPATFGEGFNEILNASPWGQGWRGVGMYATSRLMALPIPGRWLVFTAIDALRGGWWGISGGWRMPFAPAVVQPVQPTRGADTIASLVASGNIAGAYALAIQTNVDLSGELYNSIIDRVVAVVGGGITKNDVPSYLIDYLYAYEQRIVMQKLGWLDPSESTDVTSWPLAETVQRAMSRFIAEKVEKTGGVFTYLDRAKTLVAQVVAPVITTSQTITPESFKPQPVSATPITSAPSKEHWTQRQDTLFYRIINATPRRNLGTYLLSRGPVFAGLSLFMSPVGSAAVIGGLDALRWMIQTANTPRAPALQAPQTAIMSVTLLPGQNIEVGGKVSVVYTDTSGNQQTLEMALLAVSRDRDPAKTQWRVQFPDGTTQWIVQGAIKVPQTQVSTQQPVLAKTTSLVTAFPAYLQSLQGSLSRARLSFALNHAGLLLSTSQVLDDRQKREIAQEITYGYFPTDTPVDEYRQVAPAITDQIMASGIVEKIIAGAQFTKDHGQDVPTVPAADFHKKLQELPALRIRNSVSINTQVGESVQEVLLSEIVGFTELGVEKQVGWDLREKDDSAQPDLLYNSATQYVRGTVTGAYNPQGTDDRSHLVTLVAVGDRYVVIGDGRHRVAALKGLGREKARFIVKKLSSFTVGGEEIAAAAVVANADKIFNNTGLNIQDVLFPKPQLLATPALSPLLQTLTRAGVSQQELSALPKPVQITLQPDASGKVILYHATGAFAQIQQTGLRISTIEQEDFNAGAVVGQGLYVGTSPQDALRWLIGPEEQQTILRIDLGAGAKTIPAIDEAVLTLIAQKSEQKIPAGISSLESARYQASLADALLDYFVGTPSDVPIIAVTHNSAVTELIIRDPQVLQAAHISAVSPTGNVLRENIPVQSGEAIRASSLQESPVASIQISGEREVFIPQGSTVSLSKGGQTVERVVSSFADAVQLLDELNAKTAIAEHPRISISQNNGTTRSYTFYSSLAEFEPVRAVVTNESFGTIVQRWFTSVRNSLSRFISGFTPPQTLQPPPAGGPAPSVETMSGKVLDNLAIHLDKLNALPKADLITSFIKRRIIDPGFQKILPKASFPGATRFFGGMRIVENGKVVSRARRAEILAQYNNNRPPLPVFRSFVLPRLLRMKKSDGTDKFNVLTIDYTNIRGANSAGGDIVGDYLIYDVISSIQAELGENFIIVRTGGDEFSILTEGPVDKALEDRVQLAAGRVKSLYKEGNDIVYKPAAVHVAAASPTERKDEATNLAGEVLRVPNDEQVARIKTFHHEMGDIVDSIMGLNDSGEINTVLGFFSEMLFDQVLDSEIQALRARGIKIEVFHDRTDFLDHLEVAGGANYNLLRIEIPGTLKWINDRYGYAAGNEFLRYILRQAAPALAEQVGKDVHLWFWRPNASDIFLELPGNIEITDALLSALKTAIQGPTGHFVVDQAQLPLVPVITVFAHTPLSLVSDIQGGEVNPVNERALSTAQQILADGIWDATMKELLAYYQKNLRDIDWNFLAYFFNPYERRGANRLSKIGTSRVDELAKHYYNPATDGELIGVRPGELPAVKQLLLAILTDYQGFQTTKQQGQSTQQVLAQSFWQQAGEAVRAFFTKLGIIRPNSTQPSSVNEKQPLPTPAAVQTNTVVQSISPRLVVPRDQSFIVRFWSVLLTRLNIPQYIGTERQIASPKTQTANPYVIEESQEDAVAYYLNRSDNGTFISTSIEPLVNSVIPKDSPQYDAIRHHLRLEQQSSGFYTSDREVVQFLQNEMNRLRDLVNAERLQKNLPPLPPVRVLVSVNGQYANAYSMPDGTLVINQALINLLDTKDQLIAVMAHEFSHFEDRFDGFIKKANDQVQSDNWVKSWTSEAFAKRVGEYKADTVGPRLAKLGFYTLAMREVLSNLREYYGSGQGSDLTHGTDILRQIVQLLNATFQEYGGGGKVSTPLTLTWKQPVREQLQTVLADSDDSTLRQFLDTGILGDALLASYLSNLLTEGGHALQVLNLSLNPDLRDPKVNPQAVWDAWWAKMTVIAEYMRKKLPDTDLSQALFLFIPATQGNLIFPRGSDDMPYFWQEVRSAHQFSENRQYAQAILDLFHIPEKFTAENLQRLADPFYYSPIFEQVGLSTALYNGAGAKNLLFRLMDQMKNLRAQLVGAPSYDTDTAYIQMEDAYIDYLLSMPIVLSTYTDQVSYIKKAMNRVLDRLNPEKRNGVFNQAYADKLLDYSAKLYTYEKKHNSPWDYKGDVFGFLEHTFRINWGSLTVKAQYEKYLHEKLDLPYESGEFEFYAALDTADKTIVRNALDKFGSSYAQDWIRRYLGDTTTTNLEKKKEVLKEVVLEYVGMVGNNMHPDLGWSHIIGNDLDLARLLFTNEEWPKQRALLIRFYEARRAALEKYSYKDLSESVSHLLYIDNSSILDGDWEYTLLPYKLLVSRFLEEVKLNNLTYLEAYQILQNTYVDRSTQSTFVGNTPGKIAYQAPIVSEILNELGREAARLAQSKDYEELAAFYNSLKILNRGEDKLSILDGIARRIIEESSFDDALAFVASEMNTPDGYPEFIRILLEKRITTYEEYQKATSVLGSAFVDSIGGVTSKKIGALVYLDTIIDYVLDRNDALRFLQAAISGDRGQMLRIIAPLYWKTQPDKIIDLVRAGKMDAVTARVNSVVTLTEVMDRLYTMTQTERFVLLTKLLTADRGGVITEADNYPKLIELIMKNVEGSGRTTQLMRLTLQSILQNERNKDKTALAIANSLVPMFLTQKPNTFGDAFQLAKIVNAMSDERGEGYIADEQFFIFNFFRLQNLPDEEKLRINQAARTTLVQYRDLIQQLKTDFVPSKAPVVTEHKDKIAVVDAILRVGEAMGAVGVRFLQIMGQYVDLPPDYEQAFRKVYDQASPLYFANAFQSMQASVDRLNLEIASTTDPAARQKLIQERDAVQSFMKDVTIESKIGGGSIVTVYKVKRGDGRTQILKIRNPNLLEKLGGVEIVRDGDGNIVMEDGKPKVKLSGDIGFVHQIIEDLRASDPVHAGDYEVAARMLETIQDWIVADVNDMEFVDQDKIYAKQHENYVSTNGIRIGVSTIDTPYTVDAKVESFVEGETLNKYVADFNSLSATEKAKRTNAVEAIVEDYVRHLLEPVTLANGKNVFLTHSDLHPGNVMIEPKTLNMNLIDRNYYLVLEEADKPFINILLGQYVPRLPPPWWAIGPLRQIATQLEQIDAFVDYLVDLPENSLLQPKREEIKQALRRELTTVGAKRDMVSVMSVAFRIFDEKAGEVHQEVSPVPLRIRILLKNMISITGVLRNVDGRSITEITRRYLQRSQIPTTRHWDYIRHDQLAVRWRGMPDVMKEDKSPLERPKYFFAFDK